MSLEVDDESYSRVCIVLGLPYSATVEVVAELFYGHSIDAIFLRLRDGQAMGQAYVVFTDAAQARSAATHNYNALIDHKYIEVFPAAEAEAKWVLQHGHLHGFVVQLRGLPGTATAADVAAFLQGVQLADGNDPIVFISTRQGLPTGYCYVELADWYALRGALQRHKRSMRGCTIEVICGTKMNMLYAKQWRRKVQPPPPSLAMQLNMRPPGLAMQHIMQPQGLSMQYNLRPPSLAKQPAELAAAAAAGNMAASGVDHLAGSLQGPQQQQQQLPPQVFYMPLQQGSVPNPPGTHAAVYPEPTGQAAAAAEPPGMVSGQLQPMLVSGRQWLHAPAHCPAPSWPAPVAAGYAVQCQPAASVLCDRCCCPAVA